MNKKSKTVAIFAMLSMVAVGCHKESEMELCPVSSIGMQGDALEALVKKHAQAEAGKIMFNKKDKARIPASFTKALESYKLTVAEETQEMSGGFILLYGDIEENCSFDALFLQAKEELQDKVRDYLFA